MQRPDIPYRNSPNRSSGLDPTGIVIHYTAGSYDSAVGWLANPSSNVSAHFVIAKDGRAVQMVPLPDPDPAVGPADGRTKAWHARDGNRFYIGIEHEGHGRPEDWTDAMLDTSAEITAWCCHIYDIPVQHVPERGLQPGFKGHSEVTGNDHTDPGPHFPWFEYLERVRAYLEGNDQNGNEQEAPVGKQHKEETKQAIRELFGERFFAHHVRAKLNDVFHRMREIKKATIGENGTLERLERIETKVEELLEREG